jgi:pimeloyl-ACP methyl ester carboxylesterase
VERLEIDGLTIAFERVGSGPPVVLLHGYLGDGRSTWSHQINRLAADFTVVAWDAPGAGGSSDPPETFGISGYADCLGRFIDALDLGVAHVVGLSFGGALAIALQHRHPTLVRSLVLASAYAGWHGSLGPEAAEARLAQAVRLSASSPQELVDALLPTMFALPVRSEDLERFGRAMESFHPAGFRAMARASAEDLRPALPGIDVPTLLVYGDNDERAPIVVAHELHAAIEGSQLVVLAGAGHVCNIELPDQFDESVRAFLLSVDE